MSLRASPYLLAARVYLPIAGEMRQRVKWRMQARENIGCREYKTLASSPSGDAAGIVIAAYVSRTGRNGLVLASSAKEVKASILHGEKLARNIYMHHQSAFV